VSADLARLIVESLDDQALDQLARLLAPRLNTAPATTAPRWLRGARQIAEHLGCPPSRVYDLVDRQQRTGIPIRRDGTRLTARTDELDMWLRG
jgi:hypothetical protein